MSLITVDSPVNGRHVLPSEGQRVAFLWDEIRRLKREKNGFVPAHNYQVPEIHAVADYVGDSLLTGRIKCMPPTLAAICYRAYLLGRPIRDLPSPG